MNRMTPSEFRILWERDYGLLRNPENRRQFLERPEVAEIITYDPYLVKKAIRRANLLKDLLAILVKLNDEDQRAKVASMNEPQKAYVDESWKVRKIVD